MVYQKKFVAVVKSGGKILREMDDNDEVCFSVTIDILKKVPRKEDDDK